MAEFITMPKLGLTMSEGLITKWLVKEGDNISKGDVIAEVESDKSVVDYESPISGILRKIIVKEGEVAPIMENIAIVGDANEELPLSKFDALGAKDKDVINEQDLNEVKTCINEKMAQGDKIFASPSAKRIAKENNIDVSIIAKEKNVTRIEKADVLAYIEEKKVKITPLAAKIAQEKNINITSIGKKAGERIYCADVLDRLEENEPYAKPKNTIPVTGIRKVIATRMKESVAIAPHVSISTEVDMCNAVALRNIIKDKVVNKYDSKISISDIITKAVALALRENPAINCEFKEDEIVLKDEINIGIAVAVDGGLIVPVIKNADNKGLGIIARETKQLIDKARKGKLLPDDYAGGTFTVSNLGMYDITEFTSIINQPESAILSVGKIVERPIVINGNIVIRPIMNLTLTFDHRSIDGATAAIFLRCIKQFLEQPYEMMM